MQLPRPAVEGQGQQAKQRRQAEPEIRRDGQPGMDPAQGPEEIIVQPQGQAEGAGAQELEGLGLDGILHQPSSRRRKPPWRGAPS